MSTSDYRIAWRIYGANNVDLQLPSALKEPLIAAQSAKCKIYVQGIQFLPSVFTGTTLGFVDSLTGKLIGSFVIPPTAAGWYATPLDFGPNGTPLTKGANLLMSGSANGQLHIDAYQKPTRMGR